MATLIVMSGTQPNVEFYFDPVCPWCWMTSRWALEVSQVRGFEIEWKPVSLKIINEGNDIDDSYRELVEAAHGTCRVVQAAGVAGGQEAIGRLYTEIGNRRHPGGREDTEAILAESLAAAGLDAALAAEAQNKEHDAALRANTEHALKIAGPDVGVPIISIDGVAFFGPVVTPAPTGENALKLWDGIAAAASVPGFYEVKRGRTVGPQF
jgi:2-hydroxychromene-2-carboxylate isomerase